MNNEKYEVVKFTDNEFELDVNVSSIEDTVWLNINQICILFAKTRSTILEHIKNIYDEGEQVKFSTCRKYRQVQIEGVRKIIRNVNIYNLDMILSIGYRVKSPRGNKFRKWANSVLKNYLLNGYSFNEKRCLTCQDSIVELKNRINEIDGKLNDEEIFKEKIFYENQIYDGYSFIKKLLLSAINEIVIIDGYVDISVLDMLNDITIPITIYTFPSAMITNQDIEKFQIEHNLTIIKDNKYHDRFLIIDDVVYLLGSSIKDIGRKRTVISKLETITKEMIIKL